MKNFDHISTELFTKRQHRLREQFATFLNVLHPLLRTDVECALRGSGKLLSDSEAANSASPNGMWALLPLLVAQQLLPDGNTRYAYRVGIAVECFICALDLLDDVEDGDQTAIVQELGIARVLNTSTVLLALTNTILLSLTALGVPFERITQLLNAIQEALVLATAGQHRDLLAEQRLVDSFTSEECIEIAEGKAGALMSLACRIGVISVGASDEICKSYSELGKLLGIAHQLDNDAHDLYHILHYQQTDAGIATKKTDVARNKKTLPVVLAAQTVVALQSSVLVTDEEKQKAFTDALQEGIMTTWGISLLYRERAHEQLEQIEANHPVSHELRLLLGFV